MTKPEILEFIKRHKLAVIATVGEGSKPEAAAVEFGEMEDFTIIVDMLSSSRKYKNLQSNQQIAIVIGWDEDITVQIDALAEGLTGETLAKAKSAYFAKNPRAKKWETRPGIVFYAFKPLWLRYSDVGKTPWQIEEFTFND